MQIDRRLKRVACLVAIFTSVRGRWQPRDQSAVPDQVFRLLKSRGGVKHSETGHSEPAPPICSGAEEPVESPEESVAATATEIALGGLVLGRAHALIGVGAAKAELIRSPQASVPRGQPL